jgi:putative transposase
MTLSDGSHVENPEFLKHNLATLRRASRKLSRAQRGSNNRKRRKAELNRCYEKVCNSRTDWQWNLAHEVCRLYDNIFIEDLSLEGMCHRWGRKMHDMAHGEFVGILMNVADKYGCTVHKIDRFYPSSKTCTCGYVNKGLKLTDREWICPVCGARHDRDLLAANNILRRGIDELGDKINPQPSRAAVFVIP